MSHPARQLSELIERSELLSTTLEVAFSLAPFEGRARYEASQIAAALAFEHGAAIRLLLLEGLGPSAAVVLRSQYEAALRSAWLCYCANESVAAAFANDLSNEDARLDKDLPQAAVMLAQIEARGPRVAATFLANFRRTSWPALNSFVHAGLHPIKRQREGLPFALAIDLLRSSNGLSIIAAMQAAISAGSQELVSAVADSQMTFADCCP